MVVPRDSVTGDAEVPEEMPVPVPEAIGGEVALAEWYGPYARLGRAGEVALHSGFSVMVQNVLVNVDVVVLFAYVSI